MTGVDELPPSARAPLAKMLRKLAERTRTVSLRYGRNPEQATAERDDIAAELDKVADLVGGGR